MKYQSVVAHVLAEPWAIHPPKLAAICGFLAVKAADAEVDPDAVAEMAQNTRERMRQSEREIENIAVIPILGTILHRAGAMTEMSGLTSIASIRKQFRAAVNDEQVKAIVLDIDSPGGSVYGTAELASEIRSAKAKKPVYASVNGMAASAAYYLASQATRVFMSTSSEVGSIGVLLAHRDISAAMEKEGVKITFVTAGKYKGEANPYQPLSEEAREGLQEVADDFYQLFLEDVAKGRVTTTARVKKEFGEGRLLRAPKALAVGMVDKIQSLDGVIGEALADAIISERLKAEGPISDIRRYEEFLHASGRFSRQQAVALANHGFKAICQGDPDGCHDAPNQGDPGTDESQGEPDPSTTEPNVTATDYLSALKEKLG